MKHNFIYPLVNYCTYLLSPIQPGTSLCGLLYVPVNTLLGRVVTCQCGHSVFGSLVKGVVDNEVVGTASAEGIHTWELEDDSSGRVQLRDTSQPHGTSQVYGGN